MSSKHSSLDPLPTWIVKQCVSILSPALARLMNLCLLNGLVPDSFKIAKITPVLKKPSLDPGEMKNYRPISNLMFVSKLLEKVIANQLNEYLDEHRLREDFQSAYKSGSSTETALLRVQNDLMSSIDDRKVALLVMLDLSSAFDTVDHTLLLNHLHSYFGIGGSALEWISSYLCGRSQYVSISGSDSGPRHLICGVPQGSVLGPLLYTLHPATRRRHPCA